MDEIRASVRNHQPVIVQVVYRGLPGREESQYYGDHYVIITGLIGDIVPLQRPHRRARSPTSRPATTAMMTPAQLQRAMRASDTPYAFSAFALAGISC